MKTVSQDGSCLCDTCSVRMPMCINGPLQDVYYEEGKHTIIVGCEQYIKQPLEEEQTL